MQKWCIWYVNGIDYEGITEADWLRAPATGVLVIAARYGTDAYRRTIGEICSGSDWYWLHDGGVAHNKLSTMERNHWVTPPDIAPNLLKRGMWTSDEHYGQVTREVMDWIK